MTALPKKFNKYIQFTIYIYNTLDFSLFYTEEYTVSSGIRIPAMQAVRKHAQDPKQMRIIMANVKIGRAFS